MDANPWCIANAPVSTKRTSDPGLTEADGIGVAAGGGKTSYGEPCEQAVAGHLDLSTYVCFFL